MKNVRNWGAVLGLWIASTGALAEVRIGNGGHLVTCKWNDGSESVEVLDHWETVNFYKNPDGTPRFTLDMGPADKTADEQVEYVIKKIERLSMLEARKLRANVKYFHDNKLFLRDLKLPQTPDMGAAIIPENCDFAQGVLRRKPDYVFDKEFLVSQKYWDRLDERNRAVLILHEAIYREDGDKGMETSRPSRYFNSNILSTKMATMTKLEWQKLGKLLQRPLYVRPIGAPTGRELECQDYDYKSDADSERYEYKDCYGEFVTDLPAGTPGSIKFGDSKTMPKLDGKFYYLESGGRSEFRAHYVQGFRSIKNEPIQITPKGFDGKIKITVFKGDLTYRYGHSDTTKEVATGLAVDPSKVQCEEKSNGYIVSVEYFGNTYWEVGCPEDRNDWEGEIPDGLRNAKIRGQGIYLLLSDMGKNYGVFGGDFPIPARINNLPVVHGVIEFGVNRYNPATRYLFHRVLGDNGASKFFEASSEKIVTVPQGQYDAFLNSKLELLYLQ